MIHIKMFLNKIKMNLAYVTKNNFKMFVLLKKGKAVCI